MLCGAKKLSSGCGIRNDPFILVWRTATEEPRSPDGAKRNPGSVHPQARPFPDFASLHPGYAFGYAARWNVTPPSSNELPDTAWPFVLAASSTLAIFPTLNVNPLMISLSPLTKRKLQLGNFSSGAPSPLPAAT